LKDPSHDTHSTNTPTVHSNVLTIPEQSTNIKSEETLIFKEETLSVHNNSVFQTLRDNDGYDLLIVAAQYGHLPIVHYLIQCLGHHPQTRDNFGHTPLHWAAFKGTNQFIVSFLHSRVVSSLNAFYPNKKGHR
jgi:ankyrin repeat protein